MCPRDDRREWWSRGQLELEVAADESPAVEPSDAEGPGADFEQRIAGRPMLPEQPADGKIARRAIQKRERADPRVARHLGRCTMRDSGGARGRSRTPRASRTPRIAGRARLPPRPRVAARAP